MANEQNLIPGGNRLSKEEQSKGGKASGEKRRLQGAVKKMLDSKAKSIEFEDIFEDFGVKKSERNYAVAVACALVSKAAKGDLSAISLLRDTIGEKPIDEVRITGVDDEAIAEVEKIINDTETSG